MHATTPVHKLKSCKSCSYVRFFVTTVTHVLLANTQESSSSRACVCGTHAPLPAAGAAGMTGSTLIGRPAAQAVRSAVSAPAPTPLVPVQLLSPGFGYAEDASGQHFGEDQAIAVASHAGGSRSMGVAAAAAPGAPPLEGRAAADAVSSHSMDAAATAPGAPSPSGLSTGNAVGLRSAIAGGAAASPLSQGEHAAPMAGMLHSEGAEAAAPGAPPPPGGHAACDAVGLRSADAEAASARAPPPGGHTAADDLRLRNADSAAASAAPLPGGHGGGAPGATGLRICMGAAAAAVDAMPPGGHTGADAAQLRSAGGTAAASASLPPLPALADGAARVEVPPAPPPGPHAAASAMKLRSAQRAAATLCTQPPAPAAGAAQEERPASAFRSWKMGTALPLPPGGRLSGDYATTGPVPQLQLEALQHPILSPDPLDSTVGVEMKPESAKAHVPQGCPSARAASAVDVNADADAAAAEAAYHDLSAAAGAERRRRLRSTPIAFKRVQLTDSSGSSEDINKGKQEMGLRQSVESVVAAQVDSMDNRRGPQAKRPAAGVANAARRDEGEGSGHEAAELAGAAQGTKVGTGGARRRPGHHRASIAFKRVQLPDSSDSDNEAEAGGGVRGAVGGGPPCAAGLVGGPHVLDKAQRTDSSESKGLGTGHELVRRAGGRDQGLAASSQPAASASIGGLQQPAVSGAGVIRAVAPQNPTLTLATKAAAGGLQRPAAAAARRPGTRAQVAFKRVRMDESSDDNSEEAGAEAVRPGAPKRPRPGPAPAAQSPITVAPMAAPQAFTLPHAAVPQSRAGGPVMKVPGLPGPMRGATFGVPLRSAACAAPAPLRQPSGLAEPVPGATPGVPLRPAAQAAHAPGQPRPNVPGGGPGGCVGRAAGLPCGMSAGQLRPAAQAAHAEGPRGQGWPEGAAGGRVGEGAGPPAPTPPAGAHAQRAVLSTPGTGQQQCRAARGAAAAGANAGVSLSFAPGDPGITPAAAPAAGSAGGAGAPAAVPTAVAGGGALPGAPPAPGGPGVSAATAQAAGAECAGSHAAALAPVAGNDAELCVDGQLTRWTKVRPGASGLKGLYIQISLYLNSSHIPKRISFEQEKYLCLGLNAFCATVFCADLPDVSCLCVS